MSITDEDMCELKKKVLKQQYRYLVDTLGDPSRYMPYMIAADILDISHKEVIRSKVTSKEKAGEFIDMLMNSEGASAFDEFVEALLEERVQSHIARKLQQALKVEKENANLPPPGAQTNATDEELISSVASYPLTDSYHSVNEEVTPCAELIMDAGPKPPPPPTESLINTNSIKSHEDLYPPMHPTAEANLGSYNTHPVDHVHMQESFAYSELDTLRKENERLKTELNSSRALVDRLHAENRRLIAENSILLQGNQGNPRFVLQNGMPIPEQTGFRKQEMVPKGSGTY